MLNQTSEHAIRALLFLAQRDRGEAVPAEHIARALGAPANYLAKTLQTLARRGLLSSTRGPSGGFRLVAAPDSVSLASIVEALTEPRTSGVCLLGNRKCNTAAPCRAHLQWLTVNEALWAPLRSTTLADLLDGAHPVRIAGKAIPEAA